ncbi:EF-hand domain-containing protein [Ruegeria jejuensis]|uniref:EF-hand domain-containing protein n=1 Tax=Ruegeria jejuensis TaxID=3233338 RepID=UPI00355B6540
MKHAGFIGGVVVLATAIAASGAMAKGPGKGVAFEVLDADGDGQVTIEEVQAWQEQRFTSVDTDGSGTLSLEELQAAGQTRANEKAAKMLERRDANGDGQLSQDEMPKRRDPSRMFDRMDANDDGSISQQEFADASQKMGKKRGKHKHGDAQQN